MTLEESKFPWGTIKSFRDEILWWEICCLMHDVGKLSDEFLFYRQHWHRMPEGWLNGDPHDHDWFSHDELQERTLTFGESP